jgi:AcrR family transcriptional regulator
MRGTSTKRLAQPDPSAAKASGSASAPSSKSGATTKTKPSVKTRSKVAAAASAKKSGESTGKPQRKVRGRGTAKSTPAGGRKKSPAASSAPTAVKGSGKNGAAARAPAAQPAAKAARTSSRKAGATSTARAKRALAAEKTAPAATATAAAAATARDSTEPGASTPRSSGRRDRRPGGARREGTSERYRRLPTGAHSMDPEEVRRDQRARLQRALIELIAERGYQAVRILDLTKLARVSRPTFYSLYKDKEDLFVSAFEEISKAGEAVVLRAYDVQRSPGERMRAATYAFAQLAAAEPEAASLVVLGAFGAGPKALEHRNRALMEFERRIRGKRGDDEPLSAEADPTESAAHKLALAEADDEAHLIVRMVLGGVREVAAARLRAHRTKELAEIAPELAAWAGSYPPDLPSGLETPPRCEQPEKTEGEVLVRHSSARAREAEGRLPSGRHDLPRHFIVKNQRERIVDATAEIVTEKGLAALTIPEIARRANVSHQTFYDMYPTKQDAFLGAQKVGLHQALGIAVEAFELHGEDWPNGVATAMRRLLEYLAAERAHAHLTIVDTFAASPVAIEIRETGLHAFTVYLQRGFAYPAGKNAPKIAPEAVAGGVWQIMHHYIELDRFEDLVNISPQLTYFVLCPFIGADEATKIAVAEAKAAAAAEQVALA